ncbi:hypothetical protein BK708_37160 [Bacillus thuringiensis serovar yunnanensis]|nr:hypothetical protein BK708_37160 [Bacillus thuringiensis serovar yunnanensis]
MKNKPVKKAIAGTFIVTGLLSGASGIILPASKAFADQTSRLDDFIKNDEAGHYGKNRDGFYIKSPDEARVLPQGGSWFTHDTHYRDAEIAPFFLIDESKMDSIIKEVQNKKDMELTDLLEIITLHAPSKEMDGEDNDAHLVRYCRTPGIDKDVKNHEYLTVDTGKSKIVSTKIEKADAKDDVNLLTNTFTNPTDGPIQATSGTISKQFTNTISTTQTNATTLGMKQTLKTGIDFFDIAKEDFSLEFNESYTYTNAHQTLTSEATTLTSGSVSVNIKPGKSYKVQTMMRRDKESGIMQGTSRLGGEYTISNGDYRVDLNIYKKFKVIQDFYPKLWAVLKDRGIDLDDNTQEVLYTGGIGFDSIRGANIITTITDLDTGNKIEKPVSQVKATGTINLDGPIQASIQTGIAELEKNSLKLQTIDGVTYCVDKDGNHLTGWQTVSGTQYYFGHNGDGSGLIHEGEMAKGWKKLDGVQYYFNKTGDGSGMTHEGEMAKGFKTIDGVPYYFGQTGDGAGMNYEGEMAKGWKTIDGKTYYFGQTGDGAGMNHEGQMATDWTTINGVKYYFGKAGDGIASLAVGERATGSMMIDGQVHYFNKTGDGTGYHHEGELEW